MGFFTIQSEPNKKTNSGFFTISDDTELKKEEQDQFIKADPTTEDADAIESWAQDQ